LHFGQQIVQIFDKIGNQERLLRKIATESSLGDEELKHSRSRTRTKVSRRTSHRTIVESLSAWTPMLQLLPLRRLRFLKQVKKPGVAGVQDGPGRCVCFPA
jgi:hypothetical protein